MSNEVVRFWSFVDIRSANDCWEWSGTRDNRGYGIPDAGLQIAFREPLSHRIAVSLVRVREEGHSNVLHSCDNPPCCNPRHLRWGTQAENNEDRRVSSWARLAATSREFGEPMPERDELGQFVFVVSADERAPGFFRRGFTRISEDTIRAIRADFEAGMPVREIAVRHGVTQSHCDSIAKRRIWKHVA